MINRIIEFSAQNKAIVYYLLGCIMIIGVWVGLIALLGTVERLRPKFMTAATM
jgi:Cu/Ag efflux pump CusA